MKREVYTAMLVAATCIAMASAGAQDPASLPRQSLERARDLSGSGAKALEALLAEGERPGSAADLLESLRSVHGLQSALARSCRSLVARTFGVSPDSLREEDRRAVEDLLAEETTARNRFAEWRSAAARAAEAEGAPAFLRAFRDRAVPSPVPDLQEEVLREIRRARLSEASSRAQEAADGIARLALLLEVAASSPEDLLERRRTALQDIIDREKRIRAGLDAQASTREDFRRAAREQGDLVERARPLGFEESGIPEGALAEVRRGQKLLEEAQALLRKEDRAAAGAIDRALESLALALDALRSDGAAPGTLPARPVLPLRALDRPGGGPALLGGPGGGGVDPGPIAQLAADIALVDRLREKEVRLHEETAGKKPSAADPAGRQLSVAGEVPPVLRRVEVYLPSAARTIEDARAAMVEASGRLKAGEAAAASARQESAIERLAAAGSELRAFWEELLEALSRISKAVESGPSHGAASAGEEKEREGRYLELLREMVRLGRLMKDEDLLIGKTEPWVETPPPEGDPGPAAAARSQRDLAITATNIEERLEPAGSLAEGIVEALGEAARFLDGAADSLEKNQFDRALDRQRTAMEYLSSAWTVVVGTTAAAAGRAGRTVSDATPPPATGAEGAGAAASTAEDVGKPWYWSLPPRERDAVRQSLESRFPAGYEAAVRRYYERLSARRRKNP
jgi:hypothetical protein